MTSVVLVGAGNLGFRYLQGLAKVSKPLSITIVEPSAERTNYALQWWGEQQNIDHHILGAAVSPQEGLDLDRADIVISATTAAVRPASLTSLGARVKVDIWVMEKVLAQSESGLSTLRRLIDTHGKAFVNTSRRAMDWYRNIADATKPVQLQEIHISGGRFGLLSNAIHFVDLAAFLFDARPVSTMLETGSDDWHEAKRPGFIETFGTVVAEFSAGRCVHIQSSDNDNPISIRLVSPNGEWQIDEREGVCKAPGGQLIQGTLSYQSDMTSMIVGQLIAHGTCELPNLELSAFIHGQFLQAVGVALRKSGRDTGDSIPIT